MGCAAEEGLTRSQELPEGYWCYTVQRSLKPNLVLLLGPSKGAEAPGSSNHAGDWGLSGLLDAWWLDAWLRLPQHTLLVALLYLLIQSLSCAS